MIGRYLYVHSPALKLTLTPHIAETDLRFTYEVTEQGLPYVLQGYELSMAIVVRILQLLGGPETRPSAISFMHDQQGPDAAYREALGCPVRFQQTWCGFEISQRLAGKHIESADPETRRIAAKYLESNYVPRTASLSEHVAELTRRLLPTGQCSVDAIANQLAMHPRSLQRRMITEGVRCQDLIERERRALAAKYLAEPDLPRGGSTKRRASYSRRTRRPTSAVRPGPRSVPTTPRTPASSTARSTGCKSIWARTPKTPTTTSTPTNASGSRWRGSRTAALSFLSSHHHL